MPDDKNLRYRYPGTKPFEADEHELFKGRDDDVQGLSELIALNNLVVLFGRSGLGKSSLLNAGLVNRFRSRANAAPLFVRFGAYYGANTASPLNKLHDALTAHTEAENTSNFIYQKLIPKEAVAPGNLWYLFKSHQLAHPQQQSIVLIFDQFEEAFTYPDADVEAFKKELSELLFVSVPQQLRNILKDKLRLNPAYLTEEEKEALFRPLNVKALFSIRSDKLSLLNNFTDCFPSVLNTCYELKPLSKEQARQAVVEPAKLNEGKYASPPFTFTPDAVALLLEALTEAKRGKETTASGHIPEIETFQLQIVCRHAENKVMEKGLREITAADLGDIKAIFENHYHNIIDKFAEAQRLPAQRLMEEKLIIDGNRVSMPIPFILRDEGMTPALLDELINTHLLRREQNNTVEISHDTLVEPILKQYEERKKEETVMKELREKEAQIEKIKQEQQEQAWAQKQKAKRNRVLMAVISVALLFMMAFAGYAVNQSHNANEQKMRAEEQKAKAEIKEAEAKKEKEKALSNERKADSLRQIAVRSDSSAKAALKEAKIQRTAAEINAREAEQQAVAASKERAETQKQREAFKLILIAHEKEKEDPVVALRLAEVAMQKFHDPLIENEAQHIYLEHDFYKTITRGEPKQLYALAPDGAQILLSDYPGVRVINSKGEQRQFGAAWEGGTTGYAISGNFSPDSRNLLVGLHNGDADLWDVDSTRITKFKGHRGAIEAVAFSPDGKEMLTGSQDSTAILWTKSGDSVKTLRVRNGPVTLVAFSPDKKKILTASGDSTVWLWERDSASFHKSRQQPLPIKAIAYASDGKILIGSAGDTVDRSGKRVRLGTVRLWNWKDSSVKELINDREIYSIAFSQDGKKIIAGYYNGTTRLWNDKGMITKELRTGGGLANSVAFSSDGTSVLDGSGDNTVVRIWSVNDFPVREYEGHEGNINLAAFSGNGSRFITGSDDGTAMLWSTEGALLKTYKSAGNVSSVDISQDGELVIIASTDGTAQSWNANGTLATTFKGHTDALQSVALSKDKTSVITGSDDGTAVVWSISGDSLLTLKGHESGVTSVAFSPDGTKLLTGSRDGTARLWNRKGDLLYTFKDHQRGVMAIAFSQGGSRILTGSEDSTAILWSSEGKLLQRFRGHSGRVWSVAFAPDSTKILTGSIDGTARVWNEKGELLRIIKGHENGVSCAIFSPDGKKILTTSWDKTVKLWNSGSPLTLEEFLKSNAIDKLTPDQKKEFGIQ